MIHLRCCGNLLYPEVPETRRNEKDIARMSEQSWSDVLKSSKKTALIHDGKWWKRVRLAVCWHCQLICLDWSTCVNSTRKVSIRAKAKSSWKHARATMRDSAKFNVHLFIYYDYSSGRKKEDPLPFLGWKRNGGRIWYENGRAHW